MLDSRESLKTKQNRKNKMKKQTEVIHRHNLKQIKWEFLKMVSDH